MLQNCWFIYFLNKFNQRANATPVWMCLCEGAPSDPWAADTGFLRAGSASLEMRCCYWEEMRVLIRPVWYLRAYKECLEQYCIWGDAGRDMHSMGTLRTDIQNNDDNFTDKRELGVVAVITLSTEVSCSQRAAGQGPPQNTSSWENAPCSPTLWSRRLCCSCCYCVHL